MTILDDKDVDDETFLRGIVPCFEDLRQLTSAPYSPGQFRWFRSENVVDLVRYRRKCSPPLSSLLSCT